MFNREVAAHHEAAHAVIAVVLADARPLQSVSITHREDDWFGANSWSDNLTNWSHMGASELRAHGTVLAAGRFGHERMLGEADTEESNFASRDDDCKLQEAAKHAVGYRLRDRAIERGLSDAELAEACEGDEEAQAEWIQGVRQHAHDLVRTHWATIQRVALHLLQSELEDTEVYNRTSGSSRIAQGHRLSGDAVRALVSESMLPRDAAPS